MILWETAQFTGRAGLNPAAVCPGFALHWTGRTGLCPQGAAARVVCSPPPPLLHPPAPAWSQKPSPACGDAASLDKGGGCRDGTKSTSPRTEGERRGGEIWHRDKEGGGGGGIRQRLHPAGRLRSQRAGNLCEAGLWRHEREGMGEQRAEARGSRTPNACRHGKEWHLPECPGKEEEKVKKGPECREPRF